MNYSAGRDKSAMSHAVQSDGSPRSIDVLASRFSHSWISSTNSKSAQLSAMKRSTIRIACRTCSGLQGQKTPHTVGSGGSLHHGLALFIEAGGDGVMAFERRQGKDGKGGSS